MVSEEEVAPIEGGADGEQGQTVAGQMAGEGSWLSELPGRGADR